jgi:ADP-L-glycero-D-manno-heptose 6-epimerase
MLLVTGGAGFVGSHLVRRLNARGDTRILVVDDLRRGEKFENLRDCVIADYMDKGELRQALRQGSLPRLQGILHQGACTDTLERDGRYLLDNNFTASKELLHHALEARIPFVYASSAAVYGPGLGFREEPACERPLNAYGWSKLVLDQHVRSLLPATGSTVVGLRYFNVYGAQETKKRHMASMVHQAWRQLRERGVVRLYEGSGGYAAGDQRRDFVFVEDVVDVVLHFLDGRPRQGVFNLGSGQSRSFNELARLVIEQTGGQVEYAPFPDGLETRYQSFTEADLTCLRGEGGYEAPFTTLEEGVPQAVAAWEASAAPAPEPATA